MIEPVIRPCPVCKQQNSALLYRPKESPGSISACNNCGMVYVAELEDTKALIFDGPVLYDKIDEHVLTSANLDDIAGSWELTLLPKKQAELPAIRRNAQVALQHLERYTSSHLAGRSLLDFGSGWGFFLSVAQEQGWKIQGLEPLPASAVYARATFGLDILTDTLRHDSFPPQSFDAITAFQVFEHLPFPGQDLRHLHAMLRPGGLILVEVPNIDTWSVRLLKARHRHFVQDHLNFFSADTLSQLLTQTGFTVVDHYFPTRRMSIRHLIKHWGTRFLPERIALGMQSTAKKAGLWEKTIALNVGDIVTVIARKI
jgi:2-polyprenyl-3-methyl-5-hydroxy-6-metoxy-1,4-benzoquinol methylase